MVAIINNEQRELLRDKEVIPDNYFNVDVQDADGNYIIGEEEINLCTDPDLLWLKDLELIEYKQPLNNPFL